MALAKDGRISALLLVALSLTGACSGGGSGSGDPTTPKDTLLEPPPAAKAPALSAANEPPTFEIPAYERVGVGQEISFGLEVIDEDSDPFRIELVDKPATASFDPRTLTVVWKPTAADIPAGRFVVSVVEEQKDGTRRKYHHRFAIEVTRAKQVLPVAQPLDPVVEQLLTIHDTERLAEANKKWPFDRMLTHAAGLYLASLPEEKRAGVAAPDAKALYESVLVGFARANGNQSVDPASGDAFDRAGFGDARKWKLIAVRPRLDKKWMELRLVYKAPSHADTYAMLKLRVVAADADEEEQRVLNNREFSRLVWEAFFTDDGKLNPAHIRDRRAHAAAVEKFITSLVTYKNDEHPWAGATFLGMPCESRLGGGSTFSADGSYERGDAWAWNVMKAHVKDGALLYENVPIKGFATAVKPSADGTAWSMACSADFDPHAPNHEPRLAKLCRKSGHVDLPGDATGYRDGDAAAGEIASSFIDASNLFLRHKQERMVRELALDDPRRDLFEEKGMTCSQCHVRKFGVRDMYDRSAYDPRAGVPTHRNKKLPPTYFVIVPTESWQPYAIDFQYKQECKAKKAFQTYLGKETSLGCPLLAQ